MGDAIAHRGPDQDGYCQFPGVGLVHRRLSIIDLEGGVQPVANEDSTVHVIFNGEIYNYRELRRDLVRDGHRFKTQTDTEVLVHLYEEMGDRLVERLRGMFAFAIWDSRRQRLLLARDRIGIKPLYYFRDQEKVVFGSELKAILVDPAVPRIVDPGAIEEYLTFGQVGGDRSIFSGIQKLPAGHVLAVSGDLWSSKPTRYWALRMEPDDSRSTADWLTAVDEKLTETVAAHRIADVPVGAFLSGGLDSSAIALKCAEAGGSLHTFSIGFVEERFDELKYARRVAQRLGSIHAEEIITPQAAQSLEQLVECFDEPFADVSAVPMLALSRMAKRSVKVVLSGDGGDEAFGGYRRYPHDVREAGLRNRLPTWAQRAILAPLAAAWPKADRLPRFLRLKTALTNLSLSSAAAYANTLAVCRQPLRRELFQPDFLQLLNGHRPERLIEAAYGSVADDPLANMIEADIAYLLPDDFLTKVDRASMACGLEVRPPLVDHELLELTACMPSNLKLRDGNTKWLLKELFRPRLSAGIVDRPKQGFEFPVDDWLRGPLRPICEDILLSPSGPLSSFFNLATIRRLHSAHCSGNGRHGRQLWSLLVLGAWLDRYATHAPVAPHNGVNRLRPVASTQP
jgi:asparagine synthase (glutamine-hydrolysing)